MEILDVLGARLDMAVEREQLEAGEAKIAKHALSVIFSTTDPTEILTAIENATWMDKTVHEDTLGLYYYRVVRLDAAGTEAASTPMAYGIWDSWL